jgi:hypothetical protein
MWYGRWSSIPGRGASDLREERYTSPAYCARAVYECTGAIPCDPEEKGSGLVNYRKVLNSQTPLSRECCRIRTRSRMNTEVVPTFSLAHTNDDRIQRHAFSVGGWVPTQFAYTVRKNNHGKFVLEEFLVPRICELLVGNLGDVSEPLSGNGGRIVNSHDDNDTYIIVYDTNAEISTERQFRVASSIWRLSEPTTVCQNTTPNINHESI